MDKIDWKLGSNCTDLDCKKNIPNSDCFAGLCKCKAGYGSSSDRRSCKKSKKVGQSCHPVTDTCFMDKLICEEASHLCVCGPGYRFDSGKNDCIWYYYCDDNLIWDTIRNSCVKPNDFWFPSTNHHPKLSFITFILLVICFIKVMRSNSPSYAERRTRRISGNMNRNSFDLLSTIINYENNQRFPTGRNSNTDRNHLRTPNSRRSDQDDQEVYYDESLPPPDYDSICPQKNEIIRDELKDVIVDQVANTNSNYLNNQLNSQLNSESLELKNLNHNDIRNDDQVNNNQCANQENQSTSGESSSETQETSQETAILNGRNRVNQTNSQPNGQSNSQSNSQLNSQLNSQTNNADQMINDQDYPLPTYEQAVTMSKQNR